MQQIKGKGEKMAKKLNMSAMAKNAKSFGDKHLAEILMGFGIATGVSTVVLAVKATPKAVYLIEDKKDELEVEDLTKIEVVKAAWKPYIPAAISGVISLTCLIGSGTVSSKRNAAITAAYEISRTALQDYKKEVLNVVGEKKEKQIREKVVDTKLDKKPVTIDDSIVVPEGDVRCYDMVTGQKFTSNDDKIHRVVAELNQRLMVENYISLNELFYELGMDCVKLGNELGWNANEGNIEVSTSARLINGKPYLIMDYLVAPRYGYSDLN